MNQPHHCQLLVEYIAARRNIMPQSYRRFLIPIALLFVFGSLGTVLLLHNRAPNAHAATNLVNNPGFEAGNLSGWNCDPTNVVVTSPVHSGSYALQLSPTSSTTGQCSQTLSVQPNTAYTLSAYVNGSYVYIGVNEYSTTWTNSSSYTQLAYPFTTGASTTSVTIYVHDWYAQANAYVDDVTLTGPAGSATATPTKAATSTTAPNTPVATSTPKPGTPISTATATSTPTPPNGSLPKHVLTGYWQDFTNGATNLRISDVPTTYNLIAVAFANADPTKPGGVTFSVDSGLSSALGGYSNAQFTSDIATVHSRGQRVIISVGGANGAISVSDSTSATNFSNSVYSLIQTYGFDGVDIDFENGLNAMYMTQALQQLSSKVGSSLIITLAPQTIDMQSTGASYFQLALNIKSILTISNMQYYNSGTMLGCDGQVYAQGTENFMTALACIQLQGGLSASQVGLGLPASSSAGSGYVAPSMVNSALDCLASGTNCGSFKPTTTYPSIRGAMTWSINWDASNGYNFANTVSAKLKALP
jgi:chitinase